MKGLILSGGKGKRLRPLTHSGAKQLVPLANKPILFYAIEDLVSSGIGDIGIVVGDTGDQIRTAVGDGSRFGARVTYVDQAYPGGLADAVRCARGFLGDERFVMYLGDNFIRGGIRHFVDAFRTSGAGTHILLCRVQNPSAFGVAELCEGRMVGLEEKPAHPRSDLALVGIYFFDASIHEATESIKPSPRGELEITDAIKHLIGAGMAVEPHVLDTWWIDTGKMEDLLEANRLILLEMHSRIDGLISDDCVMHGNVVVESGAEVRASTLRGPLIIGHNARIEGAFIGPFSAIGDDCVMRNSEIEHSIVMQRSRILDVPHRIERSLIGRDVTVSCATASSKAYRLLLGDHSEVGLV